MGSTVILLEVATPSVVETIRLSEGGTWKLAPGFSACPSLTLRWNGPLKIDNVETELFMMDHNLYTVSRWFVLETWRELPIPNLFPDLVIRARWRIG